MSFSPRSLVGMTMSARKRKARAVAYRYVADVTMLSAAERLATKADAVRFRERGFPRHDYDRAEYAMVRARYRIGERLRPCMLCAGRAGVAQCRAGHGPDRPCVFCEPCGTRSKTNRTPWPECDGSGVLPAKNSKLLSGVTG